MAIWPLKLLKCEPGQSLHADAGFLPPFERLLKGRDVLCNIFYCVCMIFCNPSPKLPRVIKNCYTGQSRQSQKPTCAVRSFLYFFAGQASLCHGARILDSVALRVSSRPPTLEPQFGGHFLLIRGHKSSMFQNPSFLGSESARSWQPQITGF